MSADRGHAALPVLPLKNTVLLPQLLMPLSVGRPRSIAAVETALSTEEKTLIVAVQKDPEVDEPTLDDLHRTATRGVVKRMERGDGKIQLLVLGIERVKLITEEQREPFLKVGFSVSPPSDAKGTEVEALDRAVTELGEKIAELTSPIAGASFRQLATQVEDPMHRAYLVAVIVGLGYEKQQALLEADSLAEALRRLNEYLAHELQVMELRQEIASKTQSEMSQQQREHVLRQQLRTIQEELGEQNPEQASIADLRAKLSAVDLPPGVREEAERELGRLERLNSASPDYQLTRTYLELVAELPWGVTTVDMLDLPHARRILDEDHYDLSDVKERIVEQLAVLKMNPKAKAPILCFAGPPGVGKTSLGQSIARSMGRVFERLSLGGIHDEAELRGHRRTYIGAMPGRIINAIRRAKVSNPLLMLDEVDKLGHGFQGDPAAALLEILDPAQNHSFHDNYLDLPFDLSKVFFIVTANTLDTIPQALLDRMEVLRLAGYSDDEKIEIARRYLIGRQLSETGLSSENLKLPDETLRRIVRRYTREAGVRQLERRIASVCRKVATRFADGNTERVVAGPSDLAEMLGTEKFFEEDARRDLPPGVAPGLAWTQAGGEVLYVEALLLPEGRELTLTGQLGDVMKESARAAHSFAIAHGAEWNLDNERLRQGVHIHVPAGATPKDGPSAGVTMAVALASLYADKPARSDTTMTGEITLTGLVLPVGGIKEKVLAAHRSGMRRVVLPSQNKGDLKEVPDQVRSQLEFVFADRIADVLLATIPGLEVEAGQHSLSGA